MEILPELVFAVVLGVVSFLIASGVRYFWIKRQETAAYSEEDSTDWSDDLWLNDIEEIFPD